MHFPKKWTRRSLLGAMAAAAGTAAVDLLTDWTGQVRERDDKLLQRAVAHLDMPCNAGRVFLLSTESSAEERNLQGLAALVRDRLGLAAGLFHGWSPRYTRRR